VTPHERELDRDRDLITRSKNTGRYFVETPQVAWVAFVATLVWGVAGYLALPKAKDPTIEIRVAVATCIWPGARAENVEELVTRKIEQKLVEASSVEKVESISRTGVAIVYVSVKDTVDTQTEWNNLQARLDGIHDLPSGAGPIRFQRDYGNTATLMLTVASPRVGDVELELRARTVSAAITRVRQGTGPKARATIAIVVPTQIDQSSLQRLGDRLMEQVGASQGIEDLRLIETPALIAVDVATQLDDATLAARVRELVDDEAVFAELHPDIWSPVIIRDPASARARLTEVAGSRYSYRDLDHFTEDLQRRLQRVPIVAKVTRTGVLDEQVDLEYSQERLASYGVQASLLGTILAARNITAPGGVVQVAGRNVPIDPTGAFHDVSDLGSVVVSTNATGEPIYLRDLADIRRDYQSPPRFLNYLVARDSSGKLVRSRAITLAVEMQRGEQVSEFARQIDAELARDARLLPPDLIVRRTSDQPLQVRENVELFMRSLYEAIGLVVLVGLIGFREWRSALVLALSIPITLAMTFGLMLVFGVELQQISISSLILALGLLIDDPVVASDAITGSIATGWPPRIAAWLGPQKLAGAILFATLTNVAAYLPFLTVPGMTGTFIHALPVVLTLSLVASRVVSMTFVPLLGAALLRPKPVRNVRESRFASGYRRFCAWAIDHRGIVVIACVGLLAGAGLYGRRIKIAFFPKDLSYLSYVDVWLPEDSTLAATRAKTLEVEAVIAKAADDWAQTHDEHEPLLTSLTEFDGGGGPRFWFSVSPQQQQLNYAQIVIQLADKEATRYFVPFVQDRIARSIAGARVDVGELETGKPVGVPVAVRLAGEDIGELRALAERAKDILRATPGATRVRDDWGADTFAVELEVDPDRASLSNVTNLDVAMSSAVATSGATVGHLREGDREIPIVARLRPEERARLVDLQDLYVNAQSGPQKVPVREVSRLAYSLRPEKIRHRNQFRTITVSCYPMAGMLPSEVIGAAQPAIEKLAATLPSGYTLEIGGEKEEATKSFKSMSVVFVIMIIAIYLTLVAQFRSAVKPLIVFIALPFGAAAAVVGVEAMGAPLSFMALLGIISLMGVIVSHIIVKFDFIEEAHGHGMPLREALVGAGAARLRPVLITVVATVLGLVPLAIHGGPLWQPLCYAQIAGLAFATAITLVLVPVFYTIFVNDLKLVRW
jgi:multidrug efflux pump subunit AcrB